MNLKKAKQLRKMAKGLVAGDQHMTMDRVHLEAEQKRKYKFNPKSNEDGSIKTDETGKPLFDVQFIAFGTMTNAVNTFRGIYRKMKKDANFA